MHDVIKSLSNSMVSEYLWFVLCTKPRAEFKAAKQLQELNINYYLPTITRVKKWSDRKKKIEEPVIRGYIFIYGNEKQRLLALEQYCITKCLHENGRPAIIPEWQIQSLKNMLNYKTDISVIEGLVKGSKIIINNGPLQGTIGTILEKENNKSIAVSLELLNRSVIVHIPLDCSYTIVNDEF